MKRFLIGLTAGLVLGAAAGMVQAGPTPDDLVARAGAARLLLAGGDTSLDMLDPASRDLFSRKLGLDDPGMVRLWGRLLAGAVQIRHEKGDSADILWFNPLFDGGVVAHWTRINGQWQAQAVEPVTGMALRGESGLVNPHDLKWLKAGGNMAGALGASAQATFAAAESRDWSAFYSMPGNRFAAVMRAYEGDRGLMRMIDTPGYAGAIGLLDRLLVTGDPVANGLPAPMRASLATYGDGARATLSPVAAYRRKDGWTVALQSPEAPQIVWLVHFIDPKEGRPALPQAFAAVGQGPADTTPAQKETAQ